MPVRTARSRNSPKQRRSLLWLYFAAIGVAALAILIVWRSGRWLVRDDAPGKVAWGVVIAGESRDMERTELMGRLASEGKVDSILLSSLRVHKTRYTGEFQIPELVSQGVERGRIFELRHDEYNTLDEARTIIQELRLHAVDTVLLVTVSYHTQRAWKIFNALSGGDPQFVSVPAPWWGYRPDAWWSNRESRKAWLMEWLKSIYTVGELAFIEPIQQGYDVSRLLASAASESFAPSSSQESPAEAEATSDTVSIMDTTNAQDGADSVSENSVP